MNGARWGGWLGIVRWGGRYVVGVVEGRLALVGQGAEGRERAPGGIDDGVFDRLNGRVGAGLRRAAGFAGERDGGDAERVEQGFGTLDVDVIGGDAGGDLGEAEEDGAVIFDDGKLEGHEVVVEVSVGA
jgi:hypothetical protein